MNHIFHKKSGFVVLIAIVLSTIILTIALGVSKIALKEINFSSSGLATGEAQFAADTGVECALVNDKYGSSAFIPSGPGSITCLNSSVSLSGTYPSFDFILSGLGATGGGCAKVNVYKDDVTSPPDVITTITSQGYNLSGGALCNSTSPNRVEREFVAIVSDSTGASSGTTFVRAGGGTGSSFSFDIGPSGADRLIVVMADNESTGTNLTGVTVDGKACNLVARADNNLSGANHSEMWYCDEDDLGASADTVTVAIAGGGASWAVHAHLYIDASQSGPSDFGIDNTSVGQTTINVANIDVPDDGLVVMLAANGQSGSYVDDGWTSPLLERTDSPNPSSAVLATASGKESVAQTDKTYTATGSIANNRGTGIVAVWDPPVAPPGSFGLGVTLAGTGSGTVTGVSNPSQTDINCGVTCSASYTNGTTITLTATPSGSDTFTGWSGDCTGTGVCNLTMNAVKNVTATFTVAAVSTCDISFPQNQLHICFFDGISAPTSASAVLNQFTETAVPSPVGSWAGFNHDWGSGEVDGSGKSDLVSGVWRGRINFQAGVYTFHTSSDDGVELNVEGFGNVISNWTDHGTTQDDSNPITLPAGYRNVQLRWFENGGGAVVGLWWDYAPSSPPPLVFVRANGTGGSTSTTLDIGSAGTNRLVAVIAGLEGTTNLTGVTVDGKVCLLARAATNINGLGNRTEMWYCDEDNLGSSSGTVTVAIQGGSVAWAVHALLFTGANQSGPTDTSADTTSISPTTTVTMSGMDVPAGGAIIIGVGNGTQALDVNSWTSPVATQFSAADPTSADLVSGSGIEASAQTNKTYQATWSAAPNRSSGVAASWAKAP